MELSKVLRIARWETLKGTDSLTRRTVAVAVIAILLSGGLGYAVSSAAISPDAGIYVVGVEESNPYYDVAQSDDSFVVRDPDMGGLGSAFDLVVNESGIHPADSPKGRAALSEFRGAVRRYNDGMMDRESNRSAAFPLKIRLKYVQRDAPQRGFDPGTDGSGDGGTGVGPDGGNDDSDAGDDRLSVPQVGGQQLFAASQSGPPGAIAPPFPFGALLLAFAFVVPMNFVIQLYGASVLRERIDRRGELTLVAPVSPADIVAGKTLPYLLLTIIVSICIAVAIGGGALAVAAVVPIALVFLAATFVAAMFARSFKELTFLTVTLSVGLTSYVFVPAIFTEVTPVALISPLTVVVRDLLGQPVTLGEYVFSTAPFYLSAAVLFFLGLGTYREEDMFSQKAVPAKALDALSTRVSGARSVGLLTVALIPFVVVAELLAVALLYPILRAIPPVAVAPLFLLGVALIEELAKSAHIYAGFRHRRFADTDAAALAVGIASGTGFFLGEKLLLIVYLVELPSLAAGRTALPSTAGLTAGPAVLLLLAPLALHTVTASVSALGARRGGGWYGTGYSVAVLIHLAYNLGVVVLVA